MPTNAAGSPAAFDGPNGRGRMGKEAKKEVSYRHAPIYLPIDKIETRKDKMNLLCL